LGKLCADHGTEAEVSQSPVCGALARAEFTQDPNFQELRDLTARMLQYYRGQDWTQQALTTIEACRKAVERFGIGALYDTYAERIEAFRRDPSDWHGIYEAESK